MAKLPTRPRAPRSRIAALAALAATLGYGCSEKPAGNLVWKQDLIGIKTALSAVVANYTEAGPDGALRLRLAPPAAEQLARDLWHQDPVPLVKAVRVPVLVLAARQGDPQQDGPRRESIERVRDLLGELLTVGWVAGGHELPLEHPDRVASALAALAARVPHPA